jgi:hypothetical protein
MDEVVVKKTGQVNSKFIKIVYYILGVFEVLFAFRLIFKLLGANPENILVSFIYLVSKPFLSLFIGIFRSATTEGIEAQSVFELTTIIAMVVYAVIAWGIVKLIQINGDPPLIRLGSNRCRK